MMTMIWVMLKVVMFALCAGAAVAVLIFVPLTLYVVPYTLWIGFQNNKGNQLDKKKESIFQTVRNATKLYKAKLTGKEPIF